MGKELLFLFATAYRSAVGPTKPHIKCVLQALFPGVKRLELEGDNSNSSNAKIKNVLLYPHYTPLFMAWYLVKHMEKLPLFYFAPVTIYSVTMKFPPPQKN
jgi:hypothetical protein